jgi:diguanylate cyclase
MTTEKHDEQALRMFHDDFRRSLLMHRKGRLRFFFQLIFPTETSPFDADIEILAQLDFRLWLTHAPPSASAQSVLYQELTKQQDRLLELANSAMKATANLTFSPADFADLANAMSDLDRLANRVISSFTTILTDVDRLTGLLNRAAMQRDLIIEAERSIQNSTTYSIAMIDLDHFKSVNDEYGHPVGDVVLEQMAERFSESLRPSDRIYRYGGEEFLVLLPDTAGDAAERVLERLRQRAGSRPVTDGAVTIAQTVSIGLVEVCQGESPDEAIRRADSSLYRAKESGRNRVERDH